MLLPPSLLLFVNARFPFFYSRFRGGDLEQNLENKLDASVVFGDWTDVSGARVTQRVSDL